MRLMPTISAAPSTLPAMSVTPLPHSLTRLAALMVNGASMVRYGSQEIRVLLTNQYIFGPFWKHQNGEHGYADWRDRLDRANVAIAAALRRQDTTTILSILFDRLYMLRNQLVHGGATFDSAINRAQVRDGCALLGFLLPIFIDLMMDNPGHPWRMPHYPVVE